MLLARSQGKVVAAPDHTLTSPGFPRAWGAPPGLGRDAPLACRGQGQRSRDEPFTSLHHLEAPTPLLPLLCQQGLAPARRTSAGPAAGRNIQPSASLPEPDPAPAPARGQPGPALLAGFRRPTAYPAWLCLWDRPSQEFKTILGSLKEKGTAHPLAHPSYQL